MEGIELKSYSLVGKKLIECEPDELLGSPVGMIVDEKEEMIRLILTPEARKKQREYLVQQSAEFNKKEYAGTYLVSHIENPGLVKAFLQEMKDIKNGKIGEEEKVVKKTKKKARKKKGKQVEDAESEVHILERWDPDLVRKVVSFLDSKPHADLFEIQEHLEVTEGEAYWVTQDLIYIGTLPGRWIGYDDGRWVYQIISDQPLSMQKKKKTTTPKKKPTSKKKSDNETKTGTKKTESTDKKKSD
ncbi:MAG: hypothetical protein FK730_12210 [Asgard group archaeon]|nr:hypothetical protein [Asgard group archaeon]